MARRFATTDEIHAHLFDDDGEGSEFMFPGSDDELDAMELNEDWNLEGGIREETIADDEEQAADLGDEGKSFITQKHKKMYIPNIQNNKIDKYTNNNMKCNNNNKINQYK